MYLFSRATYFTRLSEKIVHKGVKSVTDRREDTAVDIGCGINSRLWSKGQRMFSMRIRSSASISGIQNRSIFIVVLPLFRIYKEF